MLTTMMVDDNKGATCLALVLMRFVFDLPLHAEIVASIPIITIMLTELHISYNSL